MGLHAKYPDALRHRAALDHVRKLGMLIVDERSGVAYTLAPLLCGVRECGAVAVLLDSFAPYHMEFNRCAQHAPATPSPTPEGK